MKLNGFYKMRFGVAGVVLLLGASSPTLAQDQNYQGVFGKSKTPEVQKLAQDQSYEEVFGKKKTSEAEKKTETPQKPETPSVLTSPDVQDNTIVLLPWQFANGTKSTQKTARDFLGQVFARAKLVTVQDPNAIETKAGSKEAKAALPAPEQLYLIGEKLSARWVVVSRAFWNSRSIWVSLGPKTKSTCTLDLLMVDVRERKVVLDVRGLQMDSHAKESTLQTVGSLLVAFGITAFSGGPKAPHEERAVQLAILKAIGPWIEPRLPATPGEGAKKASE